MEVHTLTPSSSFSRHLDHDTSSQIPENPSENVPDILSERISLFTTSSGVDSLNPSESPDSAAAVRLQKVYRSYRTRRRLADTAVVAEELWWQAIDYARLNHSTISFFNLPETAASRWNRISLNASKVGKGLSQDSKAQKLAFQHWIEAIDPRHRYGHNLQKYYESWCEANSGQPFFFWLDAGDGKYFELDQCPRSKLRQQCIKYLGPQERQYYEYTVADGKLINHVTHEFLDTKSAPEGTKWIFVMSTCKKLYAGVKKKGRFHHSSFLAGGTTLSAGCLVAEQGILKSISAYSGHYRPTEDLLHNVLSFLDENGVNLDEVEIQTPEEDYSESKSDNTITEAELPSHSETSHHDNALEPEDDSMDESPLPSETSPQNEYKRTLSGGLQTPKTEVPKEAILQRINSKKYGSFELGHQLSRSWSTGVGPRIGCIADYPLELRFQALESTELSPRRPSPPIIPSAASVASEFYEKNCHL